MAIDRRGSPPQISRDPCRRLVRAATFALVIRSFLDLLLPSACVGCSRPVGPLCARCRDLLRRPRRHRPDPCPPGLPPLATSADYAGPVRAAVVTYKDRGRRELARVLGDGLAVAVEELLSDLADPDRPVVLVPVPSRRSAARRRGGQHVGRIARHAARRLGGRGRPVTVVPALRCVGGFADSAQLTAAERLGAASGRFAPAPRHAGEALALARAGAHVVLVDDLVTTGSTLVEAARSLAAWGLPVDGAATVAATRRRHEPRLNHYG
jgi:predicted amidophosphoribosyltransferase